MPYPLHNAYDGVRRPGRGGAGEPGGGGLAAAAAVAGVAAAAEERMSTRRRAAVPSAATLTHRSPPAPGTVVWSGFRSADGNLTIHTHTARINNLGLRCPRFALTRESPHPYFSEKESGGLLTALR